MTHAFRVSETIAELRSRQMLDITGQVPDQQGGTVICDHNLLIIWADHGVTSMLGGPLRIDRIGRLGFADPQAQLWAANLGAALGNGRAPFGTMHSHDLGGWTIRAISSAAPALGSPLFPGVFQTAGWPDRQLAFVISRRDQICSVQGHLIRRFQLSAAEASIAALIGQGCSTAEIARTRQVSLHTVRNQIRAILHKMDARDRGAIIREIATAKVQRS
ncbi:LuxR C-terminal-related transcriptional regulator [Paracoccus litorisediminis]|uniref:LuxR C-terminal-related transcriptional regulator n=1 Tax=Paracoccus litorisediminis TaxID=2006130 RepID=UPI0014794790